MIPINLRRVRLLIALVEDLRYTLERHIASTSEVRRGAYMVHLLHTVSTAEQVLKQYNDEERSKLFLGFDELRRLLTAGKFTEYTRALGLVGRFLETLKQLESMMTYRKNNEVSGDDADFDNEGFKLDGADAEHRFCVIATQTSSWPWKRRWAKSADEAAKYAEFIVRKTYAETGKPVVAGIVELVGEVSIGMPPVEKKNFRV